MKNKLLHAIYNVSIWRWTVSAMLLILIGSAVFFTFNFFESARPTVTISKTELKKGKINEDLYQVDEIQASATIEDFNAKLKALKAKMPKAEWDKTETKLSDAVFKEETDKFYEYYSIYYNMYQSGSLSSMPSAPSQIVNLPYSMKTFLKNIMEAQEIDSVDFDAKIALIEKIDHFYSMTDKKGADTLLVDKFLGTLKASKDLSIDEMKAVEKLHKSITKTTPVFSLTKINSPKERQDQLFKFYEVAANAEITPARFEQLDRVVVNLKTKTKMIDTVAVLNVVNTAMKVDFKQFKEKEESVDDLEIQCVEDFFFGGKIDYKAIDVLDQFNKYTDLYGKKVEAANLEKKAREILREENRQVGKDWMYFGFFFTCMGVMIVFLSKLSATMKNFKTN